MLPLEPAEVQLLCNYGVAKLFPKGSILINEGDCSDNLYVILDGRVRVYVSDENAKEVTLCIQKVGEFFGEMAILDGQPRSASVMTLEPTQLCVVSNSGFKQCLQDHPQLTSKLLVSTLSRVRDLTENVKNLALLDVYGRVAAVLDRLAVEIDGERMVERLTHQSIASMVGSSREMVSRIIRSLLVGGYIKNRKGAFVLKRKLPNSW
ncbi:MAG: Crp/Fnr family transcriptional regulator [Candidatus Competibacteraceae bacterium]|jgi:CRP/FNR family cyclic AMP-dependent transcriptional regulator|nr:Crp/Fnr family transcriptional regulator [Candidatus Competibacteraceae bacterium]